jgi:hypothetical protein
MNRELALKIVLAVVGLLFIVFGYLMVVVTGDTVSETSIG